ncbi:multicopper like protein [Lasiosphaeria miniovina]|uniref:Multicopper like protein n=1 Tax=Lasiosphaeria miniovina TaxID=1954250 RepID=A0AA40AJY5_9PEZI|nr:multicopper like protein [Lasiosphaeria miniovina]KAK0717263.1 multicopper like protein [Lasiosphaeria miniovina]
MSNNGVSPAPVDKSLPPPARRPWLLAIGGLGILVILGLSLGLGLGLGLKHDDTSSIPDSSSLSPSSTSSPNATPTGAVLPGLAANGTAPALESWQLDTKREYVLDMAWNLTAPPQVRSYNLVITKGLGWPDGVVRDMLFLNGKFPGPLIEANIGDTLLVNVTNGLSDNSTSIHWHGLYQNGTNWFDGTTGVTQCGIPPGQSLLYNFTIENQFGTFWYHSHSGTQYLDGILGPLIIHAPEEAEVRKLYDTDRVVLVQDWYHDFSTVNLATYLEPENENTEPVPDNGLINGKNYFNCSSYGNDSGHTCYENSTYNVFNVEPNSRTRFRLLNTGAFAEFDFSVDNHSLSVIEADSTLVNPHPIDRGQIHVAQRYSVVFEANQSTATNYWLRMSMITFCFTGTNPVLNSAMTAVISYSGNTTIAPSNASVDWKDAYSVECHDLDPFNLVPARAMLPPPATKFYRVDFSFGIGDYQLDRAKVNGTIWSPLANTTTLQETVIGLNSGNASSWSVDEQVGGALPSNNQFVLGVSSTGVEVVDVLVYSLDEGGHPFHLHGHSFWILETGSGPFNWTNYYANLMPSNPDAVANPLRRDTLTINAFGWSVIRFVAENPGLWAFHCHIAWHMEAGLLMQFMSRADMLKTMDVPAHVIALCPSS